jgi:hypothetical protein
VSGLRTAPRSFRCRQTAPPDRPHHLNSVIARSIRSGGHPGHQRLFCRPGRLEGENKARGPHLNQIKLPGRRKRARSEEGFARADAAMSARMLPPRTGIHDRPMLRPKEQAPPPGNPLQRRLGLKPQHWREGAHAIRSGRSSAGSRCRVWSVASVNGTAGLQDHSLMPD